jgi:transcriptional antiterminator RfaH
MSDLWRKGRSSQTYGGNMSFWAVVQTISGQEDAVADRIERVGFKTLTPRARFRINGKMRIAAVFPGYCFAEVEHRWYDIRWCVGVLRLIMNGEKPAHLPEPEVEKIMREMGHNGLIKLPKAQPAPTLIAGSPVRILTGNFQGLNAIYQGMSPKQRELVLLDLLGRKVPVELHEDDRIMPLPLASETEKRY